MRKALVLATAVGALAAPSSALSAPSTWGQEVKACNLTHCYPGGAGVSRGEYVRGQARDTQGPGYASELHTLGNPGKADPGPFRQDGGGDI